MSVKRILQELDDFRETSEGRAHELQLSFSEIVFEQLDALRWTQHELANAAQMKESFVSRILDAEAANCTFKTAGRILLALGIRARLRQASNGSWAVWTSDGNRFEIEREDFAYGQEKIEIKTQIASASY